MVDKGVFSRICVEGMKHGHNWSWFNPLFKQIYLVQFCVCMLVTGGSSQGPLSQELCTGLVSVL